jgi:hypothetical protein
VSAALVAKLTSWCCLLVARGVFVLSVTLYYKLEQGVSQQCDSMVEYIYIYRERERRGGGGGILQGDWSFI